MTWDTVFLVSPWILYWCPKNLFIKWQNQNGILAMLDEECLRPGAVTDETFLDKLNQICATHQHFESRMSKCSRFLNDTSLPHCCFRIQHYAGKVKALWESIYRALPVWLVDSFSSLGKLKLWCLSKVSSKDVSWERIICGPVFPTSSAAGPALALGSPCVKMFVYTHTNRC